MKKQLPVITLVAPLPPPFGGMANQAKQLLRLLKEEGMTVHIVQVNAPYRPAVIAKIPMLRALFRLLPYLRKLWTGIGKTDVVHVFANSGWAWHLFAVPAIWIGWLRKKPVVINYRGGEAESFFRSSMGWIRPSMKKATTIVVPSGFLQEVFSAWQIKTEIVPNIIDLSRFKTVAKKEIIQAPHILVSRNLEAIYDVSTSLRAFAMVLVKYPDAKLTIAGEGPEAVKLLGLAGDLQCTDSVTFIGRVDNTRMPALYEEAHIALNTSRVDNMPISILEAMASGVPVVSTDAGGIPYLVQNGKSAILAPVGNHEALARAMLQILDSPKLYKQLAEEGLKEARKYDWEQVKGRWFAIYENAASLEPPLNEELS